MASFVFTNACRAFLAGELDLDTGGNDIRVMLVMTNTTADTEEDATTISGITTLDEMDGTNYARKTFSSEAVAADNTNNRGEFDAEDQTWTALGNGTRQMQGYLVYKHVTNDTDSIPIAFRDFSSTINPGGSDFGITWNAEGIIQLAGQ